MPLLGHRRINTGTFTSKDLVDARALVENEGLQADTLPVRLLNGVQQLELVSLDTGGMIRLNTSSRLARIAGRLHSIRPLCLQRRFQGAQVCA